MQPTFSCKERLCKLAHHSVTGGTKQKDVDIQLQGCVEYGQTCLKYCSMNTKRVDGPIVAMYIRKHLLKNPEERARGDYTW